MLHALGSPLEQKLQLVTQVAAANRTAATAIKGTGVEVNGKPVVMIFGVGITGALTTADFKIQQSDVLADGADWSDIPGSAAVQLGASQTNLCGMVGARPTKKYARVVHTPGGTVANGIIGWAVLAVYGHQVTPIVNDPVAVTP